MTTTPPVELSRHEFERLYAFVHDTTVSMHKLGAKEKQHTLRLHEIQDALYTVSGRLDCVETSLARQNQKLAVILDLLRPPGAA